MKRVRSSFEGISVEDAMLSVLSEASAIVSADLALNNPTLSSDFTSDERLRALNHLVEQARLATRKQNLSQTSA